MSIYISFIPLCLFSSHRAHWHTHTVLLHANCSKLSLSLPFNSLSLSQSSIIHIHRVIGRPSGRVFLYISGLSESWLTWGLTSWTSQPQQNKYQHQIINPPHTQTQSNIYMEPNATTTSSQIAMDTEVHRVAPPPRRSTLQKLKARLKETFFSDDPLRQFKGKSSKSKLILAAQYVFPILEWGPKYNLKLLKSDVVSGLTIASLAIPQGISYAKLANLPPIVGLCE